MTDKFNFLDYLKDNKLFTHKEKSSLNENFNERLKEQVFNALEAKKDDKPKPKKDDKGESDVEKSLDIDADADIDVNADLGDEGEADIDLGGSDLPVEPEQGEGLSDDQTAIQNSLKVAYDNAMQIGDKKLAKQIGNTITMFTRTHVVGTGEGDMMEVGPLEEKGGEIMTAEKWVTMEPEEKLDVVLEFVKDVDEAFNYINRDFDELPPEVLANITRKSMDKGGREGEAERARERRRRHRMDSGGMSVMIDDMPDQDYGDDGPYADDLDDREFPY